MPVAVSGDGTITGIVEGGLPDGIVDSDMIKSGTVAANDCVASVKSGLVKAWIYFDGSGTVGIFGSFNVSSLTDNGTGDYQVNFANNLDSANYAVAGSSHIWVSNLSTIRAETQSASSVNIEVIENTRRDSDRVHAIIIGEQ